MGTYTLFGRPNAGSLAVQIVLEELQTPYQVRWVETTPEAVEGLRRLNHTGKVPALELPDGTIIGESAAILIHLAESAAGSSLAPAPGSAAHARFLQWMVYLSANVYDSALRYYYAERYSADGAAAAGGIQAAAAAAYTAHLETLDTVLAPYLLGAAYSAADPYLYMLTGWHPQAEVLRARLPRLAHHAQLLGARPATRKAEAAHAAPP
jgi:glutathione S-transferase